MSNIVTYLQIIGFCFVILFPLANPLTPVVLMIGLGSRLSQEDRNRQSSRAAIYSFIIMTVSFYFGQLVMHTFGISIPGLRISGGIIVTYIGFRMLFPESTMQPPPELESKKDELKQHASNDISLIPLSMPGFSGPGSIAMIISIASTLPNTTSAPEWMLITAPIFSFVILCAILWVSLRSSQYIMRKLGKSGIDAISRLMGFLLICMGIQFGINGTLEIIASLTPPETITI